MDDALQADQARGWISYTTLRQYDEGARGIEALVRECAPLLRWDVKTAEQVIAGIHDFYEQEEALRYYYLECLAEINGREFGFAMRLDRLYLRHSDEIKHVKDYVVHRMVACLAQGLIDWRPK